MLKVWMVEDLETGRINLYSSKKKAEEWIDMICNEFPNLSKDNFKITRAD